MTAALGRRVDLGTVDRPVYAGWSSVALAVLAFWLALPPLLVRTPVPSIVICLGAVGLGVWAARCDGTGGPGWRTSS